MCVSLNVRVLRKLRIISMCSTSVYVFVILSGGTRGGAVEALRYKPEGRGFDSQWCHLHNPFSRTMALGSTQPLTEMSTRADNLTTFMCRLPRNLGALTSWKPKGLSRPVMGLVYLYFIWKIVFTGCRLFYCVNITHAINHPHAWRISGGSDK
jgi:hypothetical protein